MTPTRLATCFLVLSLAGACEGESAAPDLGRATAAATVCAGSTTVRGIDVSYYQGTIDWTKVKGDGIEFAFIRVADGANYYDSKYDANWQGAKAAGVIRGTYQFFRPAQDPIAQADLVIAHMTLEPGDLPPVLDVEAADGVANAQIAAEIGTWMVHIKAATGRDPIIYTGKYFWQDSVGSAAYVGTPLWVAQYGPVCPDLPTPWTAWSFFQNADNGTIAGISGGVDTDLFNGSLADLTAFTGGTVSCGDGVCSPGETSDSCPGDCPVCAPIPAEGRTVDDGEICFTGGGNAQYLRHVTDGGYAGGLVWTHTTSAATEDNSGNWQLDFTEAGKYRVEVYTDAKYAQSKQASYAIAHGGGTDTVVLDQSAADGWQTLGEFDFAAGGSQSVHVGDNTGEPVANNVQLVFDAVRVTRLDLPPGGGNPGTGGVDPGGVDPGTDPGAGAQGGGGGMVGGGCSVVTTGSVNHTGSLWFLLAGLALVVRRRNRK